MTRLLFVNPFFLAQSALERKFQTLYFPLGLLYLAGAARQAGHDVAIFDGTFAADERAFEATLEDFAPQVVLLSSWITVRSSALRLAGLARQQAGWVIAGGPDPSRNPEAYLTEGQIDLIVSGEGEQTLIELLRVLHNHANLEQVAGLAFLAAGRVRRTASRASIEDLDRLARPARDLIDVERYLSSWEAAHGYRSLSVSVSRGCALEDCPHCRESDLGTHLRRRSPEDVADEMGQLEQLYRPDRFRLVDDLQAIGRDWLQSLGQAMIEHGLQTPYEGLRPAQLGSMPMLAEARDLCAERNAWIPTQGDHPHAPPIDDPELLRRRWEQAELKPGEKLEDP